MFKPLSTLPSVSRAAGDILKLFGPQSTTIQNLAKKALGVDRPILGTDLEYSETVRYVEEPTVLGVSDGFLTVSVPFEEGITFFKELRQQHPNILFVGHAFTSADKFAFAQVGEVINLEDIEDTIIRFFLANAHLCKTGAKLEDGDGEKRGQGYMNLWTFLSIYTDFYNYKSCWGVGCRGEFCPKHDVWGYNGADSSGPLFALPQLLFQSKVRGVDKLYPLHRELAYVLGEMSRFGVQVDREYLFGDKGKGTLGLQGEFELNKKRIEESLPFNPKSNKEAVAYFKGKGIELANWQEATIREEVEGNDDEELALSLDYKELGNGTDRWFAPLGKDKSGDWTGYMDGNGKIHPRLGIFTSTGRMQCLVAGTKIEVLRDVSKYPKGISIEDVKVGDIAYSFDENKKLVLKKVLWSGKTGEKEVIRLYWRSTSNQQHGHLDLTPDHLVRLTSGEYKEAGSLVVGDRVLALSRGGTNGYSRLWATGYPSEFREHRFIFETLNGWSPEHVHHKDHNRLNNLPSNLEGLTSSEHLSYHGNLYGSLPETRLARSRESKLRWMENREMMLASQSRGADKWNWLGLTKEWIEEELWKYKGSPTALAKAHNMDYATLQKYLKMEGVDWKKINQQFNIHGERIDADFIQKMRALYREQGYYPMLEAVGLGFYRWKEVQEESGLVPYNHTIIKIEALPGKQSVYDLTIEDTENFIANEINVHNCTSPNLQNVSKRRSDRHLCECGVRVEDHSSLPHPFKGISLGKLVRRAIIASPGHYLIKADYSNAENRVFLYLGGHHIPNEIDLHLQVATIANLTPEMEFSISLGGPREAAKSIQHAGNYAEGLQLKYPRELLTARIRSEIDMGARLVFPDWKFNEKIVTFTGSNLARRAFGDASFSNRAKALEVASKYFGGFPGARELQQRISKQAETQKAIITPHGYYLLSFGADEDRMKTGMAMWGSNPVSHFTKLALVELWRKFAKGRPLRPILQVHDEIICEVRDGVPPEEAGEWMRESMEIETPEIPGLILPIGNPSKGEGASWGKSWSQTTAIKMGGKQ